MEALVCREIGDPTLPLSNSSPLLLSRSHPVPELNSPTAVRICICATSLNFATYLQILGKYQEKPPLPFVPGSDYSGVVESVGERVSRFKVGDKVCSVVALGSFAEMIVADEKDLLIMGKHKEGGVSAIWGPEEVLIFCDLCIKEVELGNRPTTHFNKDGWSNLLKNFHERTGKAYDQKQLKNKWDQLKKDWKIWRDLKRGETGLGWNPSRKTIDASDDWWDERLKVVPEAKKFRYGGIPPELEEKMDQMFNKSAAVGDISWTPGSKTIEQESVAERETSEDDYDTQIPVQLSPNVGTDEG